MSGGASLALSIVVPVYNEEGNVGPLHAELSRVAHDLRRPYEIVFVNDGSRDATLSRLQTLAENDPCLRIVDLDGNFGEAAALSAGFAHARGEVVVTLDGDGQNDPEAIPRLLAALEPDVDVVSGRRLERKEKFLTRVLPSRVANWLIARATGVPVYDCGCGLKAYRREVVRGARLPRGMNRFLPAVLGVDARRVREIPVTDRVRGSGRSHYGLSRIFVVFRDLPSLPILSRRPPRSRALGTALGGAQAVLALVSLVALVGALGFPADRVLAVGVATAATLAAVVGWAIRHNVTRWVAAQEAGVFRVRRVIG
jgi:glycosyltransferase involved in cell wall biosynthesis